MRPITRSRLRSSRLAAGNASLVDLPGAAGTTANKGALGFVRFDGAQSYIPGQVGPGYLAAIHTSGDTTAANEFGYLVTGTAAGTTYALPEGKSFVIGSLGGTSAGSVGGVLGETGDSSAPNTATLLGSNKIAGFPAGDVNIEANGVNDSQSLSLLAQNAHDTLTLGSTGTGGHALVFSPTYGDSGAGSAITLLQTRTGSTTLNLTGAGTVNFNNVLFNTIADDASTTTNSARSAFTINVNSGKLDYNQADTSSTATLAPFAGLSVQSGATLAGSGNVNVTNFTLSTGSTFAVSIASGTSYTQANVAGAVTLGGATLTVSLGSFTPTANSVYVIVNNTGSGKITDSFAGLANGATVTVGTVNFKIFYNGGDGNDVVLVEATNPSATVYLSSNNFGLAAPPNPGMVIDGDQGTAGTQSAIVGVTAFASVSGALTAVASPGTVVVNAGSYSDAASLVSTVTFQGTGGDVTLASNLGGSGNLIKTGADTLTLTGTDTYSGTTTVSAGTLVVDSSNQTSSVSVASVATLGGNGTIAGSVSAAGTVTAGASAALGSVGTLTTGSLTLGGTLSLDLLNSSSFDQIIAPSATLTGTTLSLNIGTIVASDKYTILKLGSAATTTFNGLIEGQMFSISGVQFQISYMGGATHTDVVLTALTSGSGASLVSTALNTGNTYINSTLQPLQHSMVESVVYSFSSAVNLSVSNFSIIGIHGTTIVPTLAVTPNGTNTVWTVTFTGAGVNPTTNSIGDGEYELALSAGAISSTYDFFRLLGDMDGTGLVNIADFNTLVGTFLRATNDPAYLGAADLDGDGAVGIADINLLIGNFLHSVPQPLPN